MHRPVGELIATLGVAELVHWYAYFRVKAQKQQQG